MYRKKWSSLTNEFNVKYGGSWIDDKAQFAMRISQYVLEITKGEVKLNDDEIFNRDEIGAKNSGTHKCGEEGIEFIQEEISNKFKELWMDDSRVKLWRENRWLFRNSFLGSGEYKIYRDISPYSPEVAKRILNGVHAIKKDIVRDIEHWYLLKYCPELKLGKDLLEGLGIRPCAYCCHELTGDCATIIW